LNGAPIAIETISDGLSLSMGNRRNVSVTTD
jgi:hypothetical protein